MKRVDAEIVEAARRQQRNVTRAQLLRLGLDDRASSRRIRSGRLFREHPGVYSVGQPATTPLERAGAAVLACGESAGLSCGSAMTLWGLWEHWDTPFEVTITGNRRPKGIRVHRSRTLHRRDLTIQLGIRVTTPARTIFDMALRWSDRQLKRNLSNALHSKILRESHLTELLARHPRSRTTRRIANLLGLPGTPTRSDWEDGFPEFCARYGLPEPIMGYRLDNLTVDAYFHAERLIVELDSWESHHTKIAFETDRERDATTLAHGLATVRVTWERITHRPRPEATRLHAILARRRAQVA